MLKNKSRPSNNLAPGFAVSSHLQLITKNHHHHLVNNDWHYKCLSIIRRLTKGEGHKEKVLDSRTEPQQFCSEEVLPFNLTDKLLITINWKRGFFLGKFCSIQFIAKPVVSSAETWYCTVVQQEVGLKYLNTKHFAERELRVHNNKGGDDGFIVKKPGGVSMSIQRVIPWRSRNFDLFNIFTTL